MDAELALGHHATVTVELERAVAEHPLREPARGQLMLALYRSGRQADALSVYRDGREALVDELGIEPSVSLQELERAILRQDPRLDLPGPDFPGSAAYPDERKLVTVLAVALAAADVADPERARAAADDLHRLVEEEVEAQGGRIEAMVGATITAAFGVPASREDDVARALRTALAIRDRAGRAVRVGVESGEAVFASGGRGATLVGAAVSAATRLAQEADAGAVLAGGRAAAAGREAFELGGLRDDGSRLLLAAAGSEGGAAGGHPAELVGRRRELAALLSAYETAVAEGRPHLVTVAGDAGVGKSRLARELRARLERRDPEPRFGVARCLPYGRGVAYEPLAGVLREELGLVEGDALEQVLERLGATPVLGLTLGLDTVPGVHPLAVREQLEEAWTAFLGQLVASGPFVLLVEDLHWAHEALLDLVERLHGDVEGPLLIVGTARPELLDAQPAWGRHAAANAVWLEPLPREDAERLLELVAGDSIAPAQRTELLDRAEGNPFFLEELAHAVRAESTIPDSVQAVLAARIDLLPPREKGALQAAAVIGRIFWESPVCELQEGRPDFGLLEAREFIRRRPGSALEGEREYAFKHALTWEVAYGTLTASGRARLHAAFADWLEQSGGGRDEHAPLLARHFSEAVRPEDGGFVRRDGEAESARLRERAVRWLLRASQLAVGRFELDDAVAMLGRALELGPDEDVQLDLWRVLGRAHALRHDGDAFLEALRRAIPLSRDAATTAEIHADLAFEAASRTGMWRRRPERELVDGWIDRALELAEPGSATRARALIARCVWAPDGSAAAAREASEIAERIGDPDLRSYAWDARGITLWVAGEPDLARTFQERRFDLLDRIHDPDHRADIHYAPITGCIWLGYFREARRLAERHDEIVAGLTPHHRIHGLAALTELEELMGEWAAIRALRGLVQTVVLENRDTPCMRSPRILLVSAVAELRLGEPGRAAELEGLASEFRAEGFGHTLDTPRLRLALLRGQLDVVERLVGEPIPDRGWHRAWLLMATQASRLDALAVLGRRRELEAWPAPRPGTYLEPFHLRALGTVREDEAARERAAACFAALGLAAFGVETRAAVPGAAS